MNRKCGSLGLIGGSFMEYNTFFFFFPVGNSDYNKHKFKLLVDKAVIPDRSAILPGLAAEEYRL